MQCCISSCRTARQMGYSCRSYRCGWFLFIYSIRRPASTVVSQIIRDVKAVAAQALSVMVNHPVGKCFQDDDGDVWDQMFVWKKLCPHAPCVRALSLVVILTHDHYINVGQNAAMTVGGLTLVDSTVLWSGIMEHHSVIEHSQVTLWVIWQRHTDIKQHHSTMTILKQGRTCFKANVDVSWNF